MLALQLLGDRPDALPPRSVATSATFEQVRASLGATILNNPLVDLENLAFEPMQLDSTVSPIAPVATAWAGLLFPKPPPVGSDPTNGYRLFFDIPPNETLLAYWNTVADRLFKIRHCMNIEGVIRELPLFEPPIDPGCWCEHAPPGSTCRVRLPISAHRCPLPLRHHGCRRATPSPRGARARSAALLQALEKQDAEALAVLRAGQEVAVLEAMRGHEALGRERGECRRGSGESRASRARQRRQDYYQALIATGLLRSEQPATGESRRAARYQQSAACRPDRCRRSWPRRRPAIATAGAGRQPPVNHGVRRGQKLAAAVTEIIGGCLHHPATCRTTPHARRAEIDSSQTRRSAGVAAPGWRSRPRARPGPGADRRGGVHAADRDRRARQSRAATSRTRAGATFLRNKFSERASLPARW